MLNTVTHRQGLDFAIPSQFTDGLSAFVNMNLRDLDLWYQNRISYLPIPQLGTYTFDPTVPPVAMAQERLFHGVVPDCVGRCRLGQFLELGCRTCAFGAPVPPEIDHRVCVPLDL